MSELQDNRKSLSATMRNYRAEKLAFQILSRSKQLTMIGRKDAPYFTWVSKSWCDYLGWSEEKLTTTNFFELIHPEDLDISIKAFENFQKTGKIGFNGDVFVNRYRCLDGSYKSIIWGNIIEFDGDEYMITAKTA